MSGGSGRLRVWPGDFGVPSADPYSLQVLTYAKINVADVRVEYGRVPQWMPIPSIEYQGIVVKRIPDIFTTVRVFSNSLDTDKVFYPNDLNKIEAYKKYVTEELGVAQFLVFWHDEENYRRITKQYYTNVIPFPLNRFYLKNVRAAADEKLQLLMENATEEDFSKTKMVRAEQCLNDLSESLGDKQFFMGKYPTSLDAVIYGYLAPLNNAPLRNCALQNKLHNLQNLTVFIREMTKTYFPDTERKYNYVKLNEDDSDRAPLWQIFAAAFGACTTMLFFAYFQGIIRLN